MIRRILPDCSGASAVEFALVLPVFLLFFFGILDVGGYTWALARGEKATQIGARWAVATDMIPSGLATWKFAVDEATPVPQGSVVPANKFPGVQCSSNGTSVTCDYLPGGSPSFPKTANATAFNTLVGRMQEIKGGIRAQDVVITYSWSGLGFSGDPNGPDVAPIVNVALRNAQFQPISLSPFGRSVPLPSFNYSLTMEDGSGTYAN